MTRPFKIRDYRALAALVCLAFLLWSVMPPVNHAPAILETLEDHARMIAEHGHSHGLEEDLAWAMHGHSHDAADHDHSKLLLAFGAGSTVASVEVTTWHVRPSPNGAFPPFRIERPPRA